MLITREDAGKKISEIVKPILVEQWMKTLDNMEPEPNGQKKIGLPVCYAMINVEKFKDYQYKRYRVYRYYVKTETGKYISIGYNVKRPPQGHVSRKDKLNHHLIEV